MKTLTLEEQATFTAHVEEEKDRIMAELVRLWELKPQMPPSYPIRYCVNYQYPSVVRQKTRPEVEIAAFVTEEQIDHRGSDAQFRYEIYVVIGDEKAEVLAENHSYQSEGSAFIMILEIKPDRIVIRTKSGKKTIALLR